MNEISIHELVNLTNPHIIDIRDNFTYNSGHIKNAINIPYYSLLSNYSMYLKKSETYYCYLSNIIFLLRTKWILLEISLQGYCRLSLVEDYL